MISGEEREALLNLRKLAARQETRRITIEETAKRGEATSDLYRDCDDLGGEITKTVGTIANSGAPNKRVAAVIRGGQRRARQRGGHE